MMRNVGLTFCARLRDETGMALVMAVGVSFVIAIMGGSLVLYSTSNERIANRSKGDLRAYELAQAGIDSAASVIAQQPLNGGRQNATVVDAALPATLTFGSGESVVYDAELFDDTPGSVSGTPVVRAWRWELEAIATVPNPNPGGPSLTRTLNATMLLSPVSPAGTVESQAWKYIYSESADGNNASCEVTLPNNPSFSSSFYVSGTLCLTNSGEINGSATGAPVEVVAKQGIYLSHPESYIGRTTPVSLVETGANQCKYRTGPWGSVCNPANHVTATTTVAAPPLPATTVGFPTTNFATVAALGSPGPQSPCQGNPTGSYPDFAAMTSSSTFDLTAASYKCKTARGELSYNATTRVLTVEGLIYFPGNLVANGNVAVRYEGIAAVYLGGTYNQRQTALCAAISGGSCNWTGWDMTKNVLLIAAAGANGPIGGPSCVNPTGGDTAIVLEQATQFQGGLYADADHNICYQNLSYFQGPSVANAQVFDNQVTYLPMQTPGLLEVPFGAPGQTTAVTDYNVTPPTNYRG